MTSLVLAALFFMTLHLGISGTRLRDTIVQRTGERRYLGLFSLASFTSLVWLSRAYSAAYAAGNTVLWSVGPSIKHLAGPVMLFALLVAVPGVLSPNPTAVGGDAVIVQSKEPRGIQRVTRHPFLWGVAIWSAFHLVANGDLASVLLFTPFFVVSLLGTHSIDRKRARSLGPAWRAYAEATSNLPFAAIIAGRTRLSVREIGWWRLLTAFLVFGALVALHPMLFDAYPLPGMDD